MITATFKTWRGGNSISVGPRPHFRVRKTKLFGGNDSNPVAAYHSGTWDIDELSFVRFTFDRPVCVDLESAEGHGRCLGMHDAVVVIDGALYIGPDFGSLMLRFSELNEHWYCYEDERTYDEIRFVPESCRKK